MNLPDIGFLISGSEILNGKIRDSHVEFLGKHLRRAGASVGMAHLVPDHRDRLMESLHKLRSESKFVLMTGGLGPTSDDLTAQVVAEALGLPVEFSEVAWQSCLSFFKKVGRTDIPETNRKQAFLPQGAHILPNPNGTAVGFWIQNIVCMPGVPREMHPMFENHVLPHLSFSNVANAERVFQIFQVGESRIQSQVQELEKEFTREFPNGDISYQAHFGYVTYSLNVPAKTLDQLLQAQNRLDNFYSPQISQLFSEYFLYQERVTPAEAAHKMIQARGVPVQFKIEQTSATDGVFKIKFESQLFSLHAERDSILTALGWQIEPGSFHITRDFGQGLPIELVWLRAQTFAWCSFILLLNHRANEA